MQCNALHGNAAMQCFSAGGSPVTHLHYNVAIYCWKALLAMLRVPSKSLNSSLIGLSRWGHMCIYIYMYTYTHTDMHTYIHSHIQTYINYMYSDMYIYICILHRYIHTHIYVRTCIHAYIHTCTHAYKQAMKHTSQQITPWWQKTLKQLVSTSLPT